MGGAYNKTMTGERGSSLSACADAGGDGAMKLPVSAPIVSRYDTLVHGATPCVNPIRLGERQMNHHKPKKVIHLFTVQHWQNNKMVRVFELLTDFPMPIPAIGERVSYGPSNGPNDDGNAIIGEVIGKQQSVDVPGGGDLLRFSTVIDIQ
jgi:hypothetical protein